MFERQKKHMLVDDEETTSVIISTLKDAYFKITGEKLDLQFFRIMHNTCVRGVNISISPINLKDTHSVVYGQVMLLTVAKVNKILENHEKSNDWTLCGFRYWTLEEVVEMIGSPKFIKQFPDESKQWKKHLKEVFDDCDLKKYEDILKNI